MRIPNKVILPFGYHIMIRQVTDSEMDRQDSNADGIWDNEAKTIYIRKRLPVTRRRYILAHELGHAWTGNIDIWMMERLVVDPC